MATRNVRAKAGPLAARVLLAELRLLAMTVMPRPVTNCALRQALRGHARSLAGKYAGSNRGEAYRSNCAGPVVALPD
jgi:hypothetical protein